MRRTAVIFSALVVAYVAVGATPALAAGPTAIGVDNAGVVYVGFANGGQIKRYAGSDGCAARAVGNPRQRGRADRRRRRDRRRARQLPATSGSSTRTAACRSSRAPASTSAASSSAPCEGAITPNPLQRGGLDVSNDSVYVAHPCANSLLRLRVQRPADAGDGLADGVKGVSAQLYSTAPANTVRALRRAAVAATRSRSSSRSTSRRWARRARPARPTSSSTRSASCSRPTAALTSDSLSTALQRIADLAITSETLLRGTKEVRGDRDTGFLSFPGIGNTTRGGTANYRADDPQRERRRGEQRDRRGHACPSRATSA